jgi:hypothetical protein
MRAKISSYIFLSFLLFTIPLSLYAQNEENIITVEKTDTLSSVDISALKLLSLKGMKITINGVDDSNSIIYHLKIKANKQAMRNSFGNGELDFKKSDNTGVLQFKTTESIQESQDNMTWIKALLTKHHNDSNNAIIKEASLSITMPSNLQLILNSRYSNITLSSVTSKVNIDGRSGKIIGNDLGGPLYIDNNYGDIALNNTIGPVRVSGKSTTLNLQNIGSDLTVDADYSNIHANQVNGNINLQDKSGTVHLSNVTGNVTHRGDYTSLDLTNIKGRVDIETESGSVNGSDLGSLRMVGDYTNVNVQSIKDATGVSIQGKSAKYILSIVNGPVTINASYANINLKNINGDLKVDNKSGSIQAEMVKGQATGNGDYNQYQLYNYLGNAITIKNRSGNVNIDARKPLENVSIQNDYGDVNLTMDKPFSGKVALHSLNGSIQTNLPLTVESSEQGSSNEKIIKGNIGSGNGVMNIDSNNGKITVTIHRKK